MEAAFEYLKSTGQNTVDGIIQWLKSAGIIDEKRFTSADCRKELGNSKNVEFTTFKAAIEKFGNENKDAIDAFAKLLIDHASMMEATFENMKKQGKNDVDNLITWLRDSKILETGKDAEDKVRKYFEGVDQKNVEVDKFKEAVAKIAADQKKPVDELHKMLGEQATTLLSALQAGASAFQEAMTKK